MEDTSATHTPAVTGWDEAQIRDRVRDLVRKQPLLAVAAAGAAGAVGGLVLSRVGRLAFIAAAGYVANELWNREGRIEIDRLISRLSTERSR